MQPAPAGPTFGLITLVDAKREAPGPPEPEPRDSCSSPAAGRSWSSTCAPPLVTTSATTSSEGAAGSRRVGSTSPPVSCVSGLVLAAPALPAGTPGPEPCADWPARPAPGGEGVGGSRPPAVPSGLTPPPSVPLSAARAPRGPSEFGGPPSDPPAWVEPLPTGLLVALRSSGSASPSPVRSAMARAVAQGKRSVHGATSFADSFRHALPVSLAVLTTAVVSQRSSTGRLWGDRRVRYRRVR